MNVFKELYQNRKLIWKLSKNDFRNKFAGAYFGINQTIFDMMYRKK